MVADADVTVVDATVAERVDATRHDDVRRAVEREADVRDDGEDDGIPHSPLHQHAAQQGARTQPGHKHGLALALSTAHPVRTAQFRFFKTEVLLSMRCF